MNVAKVTGKLKEQIHLFSGKLSTGLPKVAGRFLQEAIFGIPDFRYHALVDGIRELLRRSDKGIWKSTPRDSPQYQISLYNPLIFLGKSSQISP